MSCSEFGDLIHGYLDGELDLSSCLEIERHIRACPSCSRTYAENLSLRQAIARGALYFEAPKSLRKSVRSAVRQASDDEAGRWHARWQRKLLWASVGALSLVVVLMFTLHTPPSESLMMEEVLSAHVRSLMPGHLLDIPSSDQHTVKPWFNGKLDFSPPVTDFSDQGFPLAGGRLDYFGSRQVAAAVYQRRKHLINLFIRPSARPGNVAEKSFSKQGYNVIEWTQSGMTYFAVSDLDASELGHFVRLVCQSVISR